MVRIVVGVLLVVVGAVWFGQGMGWIGGSVMSGQTFWAVVGPIVALVGRRARRSPACAPAPRQDADQSPAST